MPSGVILIGGGAKLPGIIEVGKKKTMLPVAIGVPKEFNSALEKVNDVTFVNALGLMMWGYNILSQKGKGHFSFSNKFSSVKDVGSTIRKWFKGLVS